MNTQTSSGARRLRFFAAAVFAVFVSAAEASGPVSGVMVRQRYPWNGLVDISFSLSEDAIVTVSATDTGTGAVLPVATLAEGGEAVVNGQTGLAAGEHKLVWNADTDVPNALHENVEVTVSADNSLYMVIDLTKKDANGKFVSSYRSGPPVGGWPIEYKTKYLVLRKIKAGTFRMGSPSSEWGRRDNEDVHMVTISKDYYIAIFETTMAQSFLAGGPSTTNSVYLWTPEYPFYRSGSSGNSTPNPYAESTANVAALVSESLSNATDFDFALPTEAQWEYACRAGTTTALYTGTNPSSKNHIWIELSGYELFKADGVQYFLNTTKTLPVGMFRPNPWGLFDMYGNVQEICRDLYKKNLSNTAVTDPYIQTGSGNVVKGSCVGKTGSNSTTLGTNEKALRSAFRTQPGTGGDYGFRLVATERE